MHILRLLLRLPVLTCVTAVGYLPSYTAVATENPGAALFPLNWAPVHETPEEIAARETRLEKHELDFYASLLAAKQSGSLEAWLGKLLPKIESRGRHAARRAQNESDDDDDESASGSAAYKRAHRLIALTRFAIDEGHPELKPFLVAEFRTLQEIAFKTFLVERQNDLKKSAKANLSENDDLDKKPADENPKGFLTLKERKEGKKEGKADSQKASEPNKAIGYPYDLNTVHPFCATLICASGMKLLGEYQGEFVRLTEERVDTYIENKGRYTGRWLTGGYNKEVFHMEIGGWVEFLYADQPGKYPVTRQTFSVYWNGLMRDYGYDGDNSPHYDAGTGIRSLIRTAYFLGRLDDLRQRDDFRRITWRMAHTVMNSGESAKWGKSMGEPFITAGDGLPWCLKMGCLIFKDPFLLYAARKYEDRLNRDRETTNEPAVQSFYPKNINRWDLRGVTFPATEPLSLITHRLTHVDGENAANRIGRGDTSTGLVQDKLILRTGTHPQAPCFLMDLSFSQSKHAGDHRIGIDNLLFDTSHLCTYSGRPGNGNQINNPLICPANIPFPLVPAEPGVVNASPEYLFRLGRAPGDQSYKLHHFAATQLPPYAAYGVADYSQFQYPGAKVRRETVLLHNGVMVVLDTFTTEASFTGDFNAGVIYQVWPGVQASDPALRWVLQTPRPPTAPELARETTGFPTLYLFPTAPKLEPRLQTDPNFPVKKAKVKAYSVHAPLKAAAKLVVPSIIAPIRDATKVADFAAAVQVSARGEAIVVELPTAEGGHVAIAFREGKPAELRVLGPALTSTPQK
jgi:hypothetical protein